MIKLFSSLILLSISQLALANNPAALTCQQLHQNIELQQHYQQTQPFLKLKQAEAYQPLIFSQIPDYRTYLAQARELIIKHNPHASRSCALNSPVLRILNIAQQTAQVVDLLQPYELRQADQQKVIVLIHGLSDSPYNFHELSEYYYQQGFNVRTLLLPGHALAPEALLHTEYQQWLTAVDFAINTSINDFNQVFLGGYSTGAAAILAHLAAPKNTEQLKHIKGVFLWAPALAVHSKIAWLAKYVAYFKDWLDIEADTDFAKYESFPYQAAGEIEQLMSKVAAQKNWSAAELAIPIFTVLADSDRTVDSMAMIDFLNRRQQQSQLKNTANSVFWLSNSPIQHRDIHLNHAIKLHTGSCQQNPQSACENIVSLSHLAILNSVNNPHYGKDKFRNCSHYFNTDTPFEQFTACKTWPAEQLIFGEKTAENKVTEKPLVRLTYNPHYAAMLQQIDQFLQSID